MATNDWKTELKRRIKDIKEKKKSDDDIRTRAEKYKKKAVTPATPKKSGTNTPAKPVGNVHPLPVQPVEELPADVVPEEQQDNTATKKAAVVETAPMKEAEEKDYGEELFEVDPSEQDKSEIEGKDTSAIVEQLSRISTGKTVDGASAEPVKDDIFLTEDEPSEPTLFPMAANEKDEKPEPEKKIEEIIAEDKPVEEVKTAPPTDNLDEVLDSYISVENVEAETTEAAAESDKRVYMHSPTVVDKTQQSINLQRLGAAFTDLAILAGIELVILWISSMIVQANPLELLIDSYIRFTTLFVSLHFIYYVLFTSVSGQTPGKSFFGLRVVKKGTRTIGVIYGMLRWLLIFVSLIPLGLGYLSMFITKKGQALHDLILRMHVEAQPEK